MTFWLSTSVNRPPAAGQEEQASPKEDLHADCTANLQRCTIIILNRTLWVLTHMKEYNDCVFECRIAVLYPFSNRRLLIIGSRQTWVEMQVEEFVLRRHGYLFSPSKDPTLIRNEIVWRLGRPLCFSKTNFPRILDISFTQREVTCMASSDKHINCVMGGDTSKLDLGFLGVSVGEFSQSVWNPPYPQSFLFSDRSFILVQRPLLLHSIQCTFVPLSDHPGNLSPLQHLTWSIDPFISDLPIPFEAALNVSFIGLHCFISFLFGLLLILFSILVFLTFNRWCLRRFERFWHLQLKNGLSQIWLYFRYKKQYITDLNVNLLMNFYI